MARTDLLVPPAAALLFTALLVYGTFRALGAFVGDGDSALSRVRKLVRVGLPIAFVVAFAVLRAAGLPALVDTTLRAISPVLVDSRIDWTVTQLTTGTAGVLVVVVGYLGLWPAVMRARTVKMAARTAAWQLFRYGTVLVVLFVVLYQVATMVAAGGLWVAGLAAVPGVVGLLAAGPYLVRLLHPTREPTDDEAERLARLAGDVDADYTAVHVSKLADAETAWLDVRGLPGHRHLHVSDYLLEAVSDDELRALLATASERVSRHWLEWRLVVTVVGVLAIAAGSLGWTGLGRGNWLVVFSGLAIIVLGGWWGRG